MRGNDQLWKLLVSKDGLCFLGLFVLGLVLSFGGWLVS